MGTESEDLSARGVDRKLKADMAEPPSLTADFRAVEMAWFQANLAALTNQYPGEWLALDGPQLVAHAGDLATLLAFSRAVGHPHPFVTAIPADPNIRIVA
jgi:hypothetical protein